MTDLEMEVRFELDLAIRKLQPKIDHYVLGYGNDQVEFDFGSLLIIIYKTDQRYRGHPPEKPIEWYLGAMSTESRNWIGFRTRRTTYLPYLALGPIALEAIDDHISGKKLTKEAAKTASNVAALEALKKALQELTK